MNSYIKVEDVEELMNEAFEDGMYDTVDTIADLYLSSCDAVMDLLEDEGMTLSEKALVVYALELQSDILNNMVEQAFCNEDELQDGEFECDEDCENCPLNTEE